MEKAHPKPKANVYVPKQHIPKGSEHKVDDPIIMNNHVVLDPYTRKSIKDPMVFLDSHASNDVNVQRPVEPVNIPLTLKKFNSIEVVVEDESEESSQFKELLDVAQLMEDDNDSIENSPLDNNEIFLQNTLENLENNEEVDGDIEDSPDGVLDKSEGELSLMLNTLAIVSSNISNFTNESLHKPLSSVKNPNFLNSLQHSSLTLFMPCVTSSSPKPIYLEAKQQDLDNHIVLIDDEIPPPKPPDSIPNMNKIHSPEASTKVCGFTISSPPIADTTIKLPVLEPSSSPILK
ncbi:hypothetical protein RYX36_016521 [Vicia faba]